MSKRVIRRELNVIKQKLRESQRPAHECCTYQEYEAAMAYRRQLIEEAIKRIDAMTSELGQQAFTERLLPFLVVVVAAAPQKVEAASLTGCGVTAEITSYSLNGGRPTLGEMQAVEVAVKNVTTLCSVGVDGPITSLTLMTTLDTAGKGLFGVRTGARLCLTVSSHSQPKWTIRKDREEAERWCRLEVR